MLTSVAAEAASGEEEQIKSWAGIMTPPPSIHASLHLWVYLVALKESSITLRTAMNSITMSVRNKNI